MGGVILALVWREWRCSWRYLVVALLLCGAFTWLMERLLTDPYMWGHEAGLVSLWGVVCYIMLSTPIRLEGRRADPMPSYLMTLPIRSTVWTTVHFLYGIAAAGVLAYVLVRWHNTVFGRELVRAKFLFGMNVRPERFAMLAMAFAAIFEAALVLVGRLNRPLVTLTLVWVGLPAILFLSALPVMKFLPWTHHFRRAWVGTLAVSYAVLLWRAADHRRGGRKSTLFSPVRQRKDLWRLAPPQSPAQALLRMEWRRFGWQLPFATAPIVCLVMLVASRGELREPGFLAPQLFVAAGLGVYLTIRHYWDHTSGVDTFFATLPAETKTLCAARYRMAAYTVLLTTSLALAIGLAGMWHRDISFGPFMDEPYAVALAIVGAAAASWVLLWFVVPAFYGVIISLVLVVVFVTAVHESALLGSFMGDDRPGFLMVGGAALSAAVTILLAVRRGLMPRRTVCIVLALCAVIVGLVTPICVSEPGTNYVTGIIVIVTICLLFAAPFAFVPLTIDYYRHR